MKMKVWITKYALTQGILEREAEETEHKGMIKIPTESLVYFHKEGRDWHHTLEEARRCAYKMRAEKLANLYKQAAKLENMKF
jgi:hypothetical protein